MNRTRFPRAAFGALACLTLAACGNSGGGSSNPTNTPPVVDSGPCAVARMVASDADLIGGPLARGRTGDFVLENRSMRSIVQKAGRNWIGIAQFGGNIIDAAPKLANGAVVANDQFEEFILGTNVESSPNYQTVTIQSAGGMDNDGNCQPAIIRATGPDDIFEIVNASSAIRQLSAGGVPLQYPPGADDVDLPLMFQTDYILEADVPYVRVETTLINETANDVDLYLTEYMNGGGELELFQSGYGFGEAFVTSPCDSCRYAIYAGHEGGSGVSYGLIHDVATTTSVSTVGVTVLVYGRDTFTLVTTPEAVQATNPDSAPNFTVPGDGTFTFTRWFAVGDGSVASVLESRNAILGLETGELSGVITDADGPVADVEVSVLSPNSDFPATRGPSLIVVNQFRTDANGRYRGQMPVGDYTLRVNKPGRLAPTPATADVTVTASAPVTQDFTLPRASALRVTVADVNGVPIPAKVQLLGEESGPDAGEPLNSEAVAGGALTITSGVFGDASADSLAASIALSEFAVLDSGSGPVTLGDTGPIAIEPGDYLLSVSRGPRYTEHTAELTITEGQTTTVNAVLAEVMPTPGHVFGDFHVHSFQSLDAEVTDRERMATYVAEGMDFFTPSDHGFRADFTPVINDMGLDTLIASAPSHEMTTFDYGHFNAWPTAIETISPAAEHPGTGQSPDPKTSQGAVDWGGVAPVGQDFPSHNHYNFTPQQIADHAHDDPFTPGRDVVVQINHMDSHFGGSGLAIDTGQNPPVSANDPAARRLDPNYENPDPEIGAGNYYTDDYEALELWIGTDGVSGQTARFFGENMGDWFNLINQGRFHAGVANSDTHSRRTTALHARNVISLPADLLTDMSNLADDPHAVADSVAAGLSTMTNAPFMTVKLANGAGDVAGLEVTDSFGTADRPLPLATSGETATATLDILSPPWAEFDAIELYVNGETVRHTDQLGIPTEPPRYALCGPSITRSAPGDFSVSAVTVPDTDGAQRLEASGVTIAVPSPGVDYWMVAVVRGSEDVSRPLWPVAPNDFVDSGDGLATRSTADRGIYALAVSNPIYVDADGNGTWDAPGVLSHTGTALDPCP